MKEPELIELAQLFNSRIKPLHVYTICSSIGDQFRCKRKVVNWHSEAANIVKNMKGEEMGHLPNRLAQILSVMLDDKRIIKDCGKHHRTSKISTRRSVKDHCGGSVWGLTCLASTYCMATRKIGPMCEDVFRTSSQEKESMMKLNPR